jgi:cytochrome P450
MRNQINNQIREEELNPFKRYNPLHPVVEWYRGRKMDQYISAELDKRYQEWRNASSAPKTKSVIDLALSGYMQNRTAGETLDPEFKKWACAQIRLFLFVGHDSTAATIVYSLYLLSKYPEAMKRVRKEHEEVFGTDVSRLPETIKANPHLTNRLPFTTAVIKETLRLFPPAASFRGGQPNSPLRHPDSDNPIKYQTSSVGVWIVHDALHRHPSYWPEPHSFIPDRWLVESSHPLYPTSKWAWRPFEHGSRNCPGQTLVMLDIKVTLAMVVREFNVRDAYEEWDKLMGSKGLKTVQGERAYQVSKGSLHPADGFPCRVSIRKPTS